MKKTMPKLAAGILAVTMVTGTAFAAAPATQTVPSLDQMKSNLLMRMEGSGVVRNMNRKPCAGRVTTTFGPASNSLSGFGMNSQTPPDMNQMCFWSPSNMNGQAPAGMQNGQPGQGQQNRQMPSGLNGQAPGGIPNETMSNTAPGIQNPEQMVMPGAQQNGTIQSSADSPSAIVEGITINNAASIEVDYENATVIVVTEDNNQIKITEAGTYIITGSASDGNIVVKKDLTGVALVLEDLTLTSTTGATLSVNKNSEVKIVISGDVTLTDSEDPADEDSADADVADAFDGAAMKFKAGSSVYLTGDGILTIIGSAKNGIKTGDDSSLVIDGDLTIDITAANDGINASYDLAILDGDITIDAEDDGIHADHILTIGSEDGSGPDLTVEASTEGVEATVVNIKGGDITVNASDDGINAANADGVYEGELDYAINQTGGSVSITAGTDGMDSNGDVNLVGGSASIRSASNGGDAGIDYDGDLYVSGDYSLNNASGVAGPDNMMGGMPGQPGNLNGQMGGQPGGMNGQMGGQPGNMSGQMGGQPGNMSGQMGGQPGNMGGQPGNMNGQTGGQPGRR